MSIRSNKIRINQVTRCHVIHMSCDESNEIQIDKYKRELAETKEHYTKGKEFSVNLDEISKLCGINFNKQRPDRSPLKSPEVSVVINAFYKNKK